MSLNLLNLNSDCKYKKFQLYIIIMKPNCSRVLIYPRTKILLRWTKENKSMSLSDVIIEENGSPPIYQFPTICN